MGKVLCFGELLLRFSPQLNSQWIRKGTMPVFIGGAELNTATALALWNVPVFYFTALPDHYLSKEIVKELEEKGIDASRINFSGDRIGTYYLPQGADLKNAGVIYDRAYSSFYNLKPGQLDWDALLDGVSWFDFSAISPALNENIVAVCIEGLEAASKKGITISVDLNYRAKLWQYGKHPADVMPQLVPYCDVVMGNIWAAEQMLGIPVAADLIRTKEHLTEQAQKTSRAIVEKFPKCSQVYNTFRFDNEDNHIKYYASLYTGGETYFSKEHHAVSIVDKVGSGDCFMAGLIYGNYNTAAPQEIIDFAASAAFTKLFIKGDATTTTVEQIKKGYANG